MSKELKVGQRVRLKEDLRMGGGYKVHLNSSMTKYRGKETTIRTEVSPYYGKYTLEIDNGSWTWTDDMFDIIEDEKEVKITDKVKYVQEGDTLFIIVEEKYTIAVPTKVKVDEIGLSVKIDSDEYNEEVGKALALYRLVKGGK